MTLLLLWALTGSVLIPIKAVVISALSLPASIGAMVWGFQDGHLAGLLNITPIGGLEPVIVLLTCVFAFGLSTDYEVFLLAAVLDARLHGEPTPMAITTAIRTTGRTITTAAALLVVVFLGKVIPIDVLTLLRGVTLFLLLPFSAAYTTRTILRKTRGPGFVNGRYKRLTNELKLWALVAVVIGIFATQPRLDNTHLRQVGLIIATITAFFIGVFMLALTIGRIFKLSYQDTAAMVFETTPETPNPSSASPPPSSPADLSSRSPFSSDPRSNSPSSLPSPKSCFDSAPSGPGHMQCWVPAPISQTSDADPGPASTPGASADEDRGRVSGPPRRGWSSARSLGRTQDSDRSWPLSTVAPRARRCHHRPRSPQSAPARRRVPFAPASSSRRPTAPFKTCTPSDESKVANDVAVMDRHVLRVAPRVVVPQLLPVDAGTGASRPFDTLQEFGALGHEPRRSMSWT